MDDTPDLYLHAVLMALNTSFPVENYTVARTTRSRVRTSTDGLGCFFLTGGLIQDNRGPVGPTSGEDS